jgi:type I restriction enzyme R subunit
MPILDVPFAYSSNGDAFLEYDRTATSGTVTREIPLDRFPSPEELWTRYQASKGYTPEQEAVVTQDYHEDGSQKTPRYYQLIAINRTVDAIARGENRILLVMATGTGKTYTAFQIIWRLWKSKAKKRILFLVDRNILADQTKTNDFKPFGQAMTKITNRTADKAFEIYLSLYQAVTGTEEEQNIYKLFSPDFFDLVIVDECHRGSAAEDAAWRKVLEYFSSATQIGLTATPKETTIVFCENIDHAERMRQALVNANPDLAAANSKYVMRITGDNDEGKDQLDNFIDPAEAYPVIACTSLANELIDKLREEDLG